MTSIERAASARFLSVLAALACLAGSPAAIAAAGVPRKLGAKSTSFKSVAGALSIAEQRVLLNGQTLLDANAEDGNNPRIGLSPSFAALFENAGGYDQVVVVRWDGPGNACSGYGFTFIGLSAREAPHVHPDIGFCGGPDPSIEISGDGVAFLVPDHVPNRGLGMVKGMKWRLAGRELTDETEEPCAIRAPMKKVSSLKNVVARQGGLAFNCGGSQFSVLRPDSAFEALRWPSGPDCQQRTPVTFAGQSGSASCTSKSSQTPIRFEASVSATGADVMLASIQCDEQRIAGAWTAEPFRQYGSKMAWSLSPNPLIELIPGAKKGDLFEAVKERLLQPVDGICPLVFEGPPARVPRAVSEVFFAKAGDESQAKEVAQKLEGIIGPVAVKPWPGQWDYGVVVVVGEAIAKP